MSLQSPGLTSTKKDEKYQHHLLSGSILNLTHNPQAPNNEFTLDVDNFSVRGSEAADPVQLHVIYPPLRPLAFTRHILMRITETFDEVILQGKRNYEFFNTFGARIFIGTVIESSQPNCYGTFEAYIWNHEGTGALKLDGTCGCFGRGGGVTISLPNEIVIGAVKQETQNCYVEYLVLDNLLPRSYLLKIKGPRLEWCCVGGLGSYTDFQIYSDKDKYIGKVSQHWDRLGENFVHDDEYSFRSYGASVPIEISVNLKTIILGALVLLDIQYFPSMKERNHIFENQDRHYITHSIGLCVLILVVSVYIGLLIGLKLEMVHFFGV